MDIKDLRCFVAAYESKSFSRAAVALGTVQSNVSTRILALERAVGVALFERQHRRLVPTRVGKRLYGPARKILAAVCAIERDVRREARRRKRRRRTP